MTNSKNGLHESSTDSSPSLMTNDHAARGRSSEEIQTPTISPPVSPLISTRNIHACLQRRSMSSINEDIAFQLRTILSPSIMLHFSQSMDERQHALHFSTESLINIIDEVCDILEE